MKLASIIGQTLDAKYQIERQLGKGGMGAVFLATHVGTGRNVALKIIMPQFMQQDEFIERFRREARAAGRLRHPNVVDVTDFGFAHLGNERVAYLVMEYLDGCTLDEVLEEEERLPLPWVVDILEQTCSAVEEAHQQGIIHRDLKPDNIWLEPNRRGGFTVKVLDFGIAKLEECGPESEDTNFDASAATLIGHSVRDTHIHPRPVSEDAATLITGGSAAPATQAEAGAGAARALATKADFSEGATLITPTVSAGSNPAMVDGEGATRILTHRTTDERSLEHTSGSSSLTRVGALLGTPLFMSPEQCHGRPLDARTDVYSLGVIAYRMLSGKTPFVGAPADVMQKHKEHEPPPLVARKTSKKLRRVVMSALAKDRDQRPPSAAAFANSLRSYSEGVWALVQSGLLLFLEHLPAFLKLSLLVYAPMIAVTIVQSTLKTLERRQVIPHLAQMIISAVVGIVSFPVQLMTAFVVSAATTWMVVQLLGAPLRPLLIRPALLAVWRRKWPLIGTVLLTILFMILGCIPPIVVLILARFVHGWIAFGVIPAFIPFVVMFLGFALAVPVVMMEKLSGMQALRRSMELSWRSKRTVAATLAIHFFVPILLALLTLGVLALIAKALGRVDWAKDLFNLVFPLIWLPAQIFLGAVAAVITGLLYLKTRQAGGEPVRLLLRDLDDADRPQPHWQRRMRERLTTGGRTTTR
jgi:serine/threonine protein kinase